ncbi:MAG: sensor histidine kinase [Leptonema sp. (in: Bacteria)]|nr:sensor histidine kinase [Leptonema sp. (in: bacteria)]
MRTIQTFQLATLDNQSRDSIHDFFMGLEKRFSKEGMGDTIYNVVQELVTNAVKANLKRTFFQSNGFTFDGGESYSEGLKKFKESLNTISEDAWKEAVHSLGFQVTVEIDVDEERILIYVENNAVMIPEEERRLRARLARAMEVRNLIKFSEQYGDDTEGAGLGLALVIMLIKDLGFDPDYFRVFTRGNSTVARLEFPLHRDYVPIRQRWQIFGSDGQK